MPDNRPACSRCNLVVTDKCALDSHLLTCGGPSDDGNGPTSFSKVWIDTRSPNLLRETARETNIEDEGTEKSLPPSQPLAISESVQQYLGKPTPLHACNICHRELKTAKGLKLHYNTL